MSKLLSMPFLVEKYLKKTQHLSLEEHGTYCLLLFHMWQNGGSLPDNDTDLARMLGASPAKWKKLRARVGGFFEVHNGSLMQERLQKQWNYAVENHNRNSEKASKAAKLRWEKERAVKGITTVLQAMPQAYPKQCSGDAILKNSNNTSTFLQSEPTEAAKRLFQTSVMKRTHQ